MKKEKSCGTVIIYNNKILVVEQTNGFLGFPKGHMEQGESEEETAIRETKEETNIDVSLESKFRYVTTYITDKHINKEVVFFRAKPISFDLKKAKNEIMNINWLSFEEVMKLFVFDNQKKLLSEVLKDLDR